MLFLNVGASAPGLFVDVSDEQVESQITLNSLACIYTAKVLLKQMLERGKRCAIVTTSSGLRLIPCPGAVAYSSSKAFASWFTMALNYELKMTGK